MAAGEELAARSRHQPRPQPGDTRCRSLWRRREAVLNVRAAALPTIAGHPALATLFWCAYCAWIASEVWIFARDRRRAEGEGADRGSLGLLVLLIGGGIALAFSLAGQPAGRIDVAPAWLVVPGSLMTIGGAALRLWAVLTLGRFFRVAVFTHDDHRLIDSGPYRKLRNPSYTGSMITIAGLGVATGNALSLLACVGLALIGFVLRIRVEERSLAARFGADYERYRLSRWALVPGLW